MTDTAELLRTDEAADQLGLTIRQIYTLIENGDLEGIPRPVEGRAGRWVHVRRSELDAYRARQTV
ncbi:MAG: helix-turn-helix domain-containing protein [Acidimicrobiia bacterium]|nr:helix-turn-helix domain-containing protein [Acidimicrobiia bacterium]